MEHIEHIKNIPSQKPKNMPNIPLAGNTESFSSHDNINDNQDTLTDENLHQRSSSSSCHGDLPIVERLPSRNISFHSAEILTLEELSHSLLLATSNKTLINERNDNETLKCIFQEKPLEYVRVTGVILDMVIIEESNSSTSSSGTSRKSFLLLGDPLFAPNTASIRTVSSRSKSACLSTPQQSGKATLQAVSNTNDAATTNPVTNTSNLAAASHFSVVGKTLSGKKRRLVTIKPRTHSSLLNKQCQSQTTRIQRATPSNMRLNNENQKSNSKSIQDTRINFREKDKWSKQKESLIRKCRQGMHMVIVDVTHGPCVDGCQLEDLVMVIGLVSFETIRLDDLDGDKFLQVAHLIDEHHVCSSRCEIPTDVKEGEEQHRAFGYVQSRIVRVVNGLDMNLFRESLLLRREWLVDFVRSVPEV